MTLPLLVVLLGPTASGKTSLSLRLARRFRGEVVSCDSVAVYRDMEIGTAKPSRQERAEIRHHLIDVTTPDRPYSAGDYSRAARAAITDISERGCLPLVTGGTGLYLRALLNGLFAGPMRSEGLRDRLRALEQKHSVKAGAGHLHRMLRRIDGRAAAAIHANDLPKIIRALEVALTSGKPMTAAWKDAAPEPLRGYRVLRIGLDPDRQQLYGRINERAAAMFGQQSEYPDGLIGETRMLMEKYLPELKALNALGYRQAAAHLRGELTRDAAVQQSQQGHRNYAKRQMTWFRREPAVHWLEGFGDDTQVADQAEALVAAGFISQSQ